MQCLIKYSLSHTQLSISRCFHCDIIICCCASCLAALSTRVMFASADGTHSSLRPRQTRGPRLSSFWLPTFNTTLLSSVHFNSTRLDSTTLHPLTLDVRCVQLARLLYFLSSGYNLLALLQAAFTSPVCWPRYLHCQSEQKEKESAASVSCSFILELTTKSSLAGALSAVCVLCRLSKGTRRKMKLLRMRLYYYLLPLSVGCLLFCPSGLKLRSRERMTNGLTNTPT